MTLRKFWVAAILVVPASVTADSGGATSQGAASSTDPLWEIGAGAAGALTPHYPGASGSRSRLLPVPLVIYRGRILRTGDGSVVSGRLFKSDALQFDVSLSGSFDADSDDVSARDGMPDLGFLFEVGPELEWTFWRAADSRQRLKLELPLRAAFSADDGDFATRGWVFNPELEYERDGVLGPDSELSLSVASAWTGEQLAAYFYDVAPRYATAGRPQFEARAGYLQSTLGITLSHRRGARRTVAGVRWHSYSGSANEASPLFRDESGWTVFAGVFWTLWESERRVAQ